MAGGAFVAQGGRHYEGGVTVFVVVTCLVAAMGGLIFGYDLGISGGVTSMEQFLIKFFPSVHKKMTDETGNENAYCKFDSHLLTLFTSSLYVAALVASFFASTITRVFGRKPTMFLGGLVFLVGSILNGVAEGVVVLIIGRLLLGVGVGFANQSVPVYLSEMAPAKIRGALNMGFQMAITIGILVANLVNYGTAKIKGGWGWRVSLALAAVPAIMMTVGAIFLPETPNSILERGNQEKAKKMLQRIRGTDNVEEEFQDLLEASEAAKQVDHPWTNILQPRYRPQLIAVGVMIGLKFGVNGLGTLTSTEANLVLFFICAYVAAFAWSWGPLGWLVPSEICPLEIRSAGQAINVSVNMFFTFIIAQGFLALLCHLKFGLFFFFAGFVIIMTIFVAFFVPETKNVPIEEINRVWKAHWFWGKYIPVEAVIGGKVDKSSGHV
ncbi:hypothetical protein TIFTF001_021695 [Ficus carica]|uniref:Major facilitator superfamily (MFS) profile domain-containing protein n=1 Tax=Ficus carica TaxID=3494 RepID=A0AA88DC40_FICCA|nr:hypothetical protein TIFTF001_021695 [Ficus carica]